MFMAPNSWIWAQDCGFNFFRDPNIYPFSNEYDKIINIAHALDEMGADAFIDLLKDCVEMLNIRVVAYWQN